MKKEMRMIALVVAAVLMTGMIAGCNKAELDIHTPGNEDNAITEDVQIDLALEIVPLTEAPAMFNDIPMPTAPGTQTRSNTKAIIDYSNSSDGYIMVRYKASINKQLRVIVTGPSDTKYTYTLKQNAEFDVYPLSDGNGRYSVGVYEQIEGSRYSTSLTANINVTLDDEFAPFIRPNQYVNYKTDSQTVAKAAELIEDADNLPDKISAIYYFVVRNLSYDRQLAATVQSGYLPDVDAVLAKGKGICFDYAAVMASMLRSQGIPTRLVVGYAGTAYHAWIDVYSEEEGWINNYIFFDGEHWKLMDPTFASSGNQSSAVMQYIGDGTNYSVKYLY